MSRYLNSAALLGALLLAACGGGAAPASTPAAKPSEAAKPAAAASTAAAPASKPVAAITDGTPYVLIAQPELKKAAELKGKTFGASAVRGGADTTSIMVMMLENGVKPTEYTIVQAGSVSDRTVAMKAKSIQGLAQLEPQASLLRNEGFPEIDNANNYGSLKNVQSITLSAKKSWYDANQAVA